MNRQVRLRLGRGNSPGFTVYLASLFGRPGERNRAQPSPLAPRRRVVVAAEVPADWVVPEPDRGRSAVRVDHAVPVARVVSGHLDDTAAEVAVAAAADAVVAAELGSDDAQFVVDEADGHELMWYAAQELDALVELG